MTAAVLVAADEPPVEGPPGQPYVSPDDLASITPLWQQAVAQTLIPVVAEVFHASAGVVHARMVDATQVPTLPSIGSLAAEQYLAQAGNTFAKVGERLWATARSELLDGFEKGESIPQLADRLRASAGMTAKTATLVARTQVLDASNAGSIATARATGLELRKGWLDTPDQRTRPTHHQAGNTYGSDQGMIPLGDQFTVGGYQCDRPHDPTLPPAEKFNCRCALIYSMVDAAVKEAVRDATPPPPVPGTSGIEPPPPVVPLAKRTVAQLRALAADRKIPIPAGARKPDIVRLLEAPPLTQAEERAAARAAARETNRLIEESTANAQVLAEVDALLAKKAPVATIREALDAALVEPGQLFAGADPAILAALRAVAADPVKLRAAVTRLGGKIKVKPVSRAGAKVTFDADTMEGVGGIDIPAGAKVTVVRRGSTVTLPDGTVMQLEKARVTRVAAPAKKAAPVKRAPAPKASPSQRQPGRDLLPTSTAKAEPVEVLKAAAQRDAWVDRAAAEQRFGDPVIKVLTTAVRQQDGWSTPARVVTPAQLDRLVDSGWTEMWRGVEANHTGVPSISATDIARATRTGDWQMTKGIYGNGVYTTARRTTAEMYRGGTIPDFDFRRGIPAESFGPAPMYEYLPGLTPSPQGSGGLMRMVLDPDAKIIDYEDLRAEHREFLSSEAYHSMPYGAFKRELGDSSFYAVMRGYDGIRVHGPHHNDGAIYPEGVTNRDEPPQWVIFNRSVLVFERASKRYDT